MKLLPTIAFQIFFVTLALAGDGTPPSDSPCLPGPGHHGPRPPECDRPITHTNVPKPQPPQKVNVSEITQNLQGHQKELANGLFAIQEGNSSAPRECRLYKSMSGKCAAGIKYSKSGLQVTAYDLNWQNSDRLKISIPADATVIKTRASSDRYTGYESYTYDYQPGFDIRNPMQGFVGQRQRVAIIFYPNGRLGIGLASGDIEFLCNSN